MPIGPLNPPPMREKFIGDLRGSDQNTGISRAWYLWLKNTFETILALVTSVSGSTIINATQAELGGLAAILTLDDAGQLVYVTDYNHLLRWTGTGFALGPGENGSGYISAFHDDPSPTTGWKLCDGTATSKLNSDGTTSAITVPDYTTSSYLKLATVLAAGPAAASGASGSTSGGTPAGTVSAPVFTGTLDDTGNNDASQEVQSGAGVTVAADPHAHPFTPGGTNSAPTFTGAALAGHTHTPGTIELQRTQLKAWYRR